MAETLKLRTDSFRTQEFVRDLKDRAGGIADIALDTLIRR
jgi:hypothetical protein